MDQAKYNQRHSDLCDRYMKTQKRVAEIKNLCMERVAKRVKIQMFMKQLTARDTLVEDFDEERWYSTVDYVTVYRNNTMIFIFRDGLQVTIKADIWRAA